jgi:hypothetical protein
MTGPIVMRNNVPMQWLDGAAIGRPIMFLIAANRLSMRPGSNVADIELEDFAGNPWLRVTNDATNPIFIWINGVFTQVLPSAANSGGTGFCSWRTDARPQAPDHAILLV